MPTLAIYRADTLDRRIELGDRDVRIGRSDQNDIVLEDPNKGISRFHAELRREGDEYAIVDLNSQNGIWMGGQRIQRSALEPGAAVTIGAYRLVFEAAAPEPANAGVAESVSDAETTSGRVGSAKFPERIDLPSTPAVGTRRAADSGPAAAARPATGPVVVPAGPPAEAQAKPPGPSARPGQTSKRPGSTRAKSRLPGFAAFIAVAIVVIGAAVWLALQSRSAQPPEGTATEQAPSSQGQKAGDETEQAIALHLAEGKALLDRGEFEAAVRDHFDQILMINPGHTEALDLKAKAEELVRARSATAAAAAAVAAPSSAAAGTGVSAPAPSGTSTGAKEAAAAATATPRADQPPVPGAVARRPGESAAAWKVRSRQMSDRYAAAKALVGKSDYPAAIAAFEAILGDEPGYLDVSALLDEARTAVAAAAKEALEAGGRLEKSGDLAGAEQQYQRAKQIDGSLVAADEGLQRLRTRVKAEAEDAYKRARQYDALGRVAEAIKMYERVVLLLPQDDPTWKAAKDRLEALKAGIR